MIDTIDMLYYFPNRIQYNTCFGGVDTLARKQGQALHKSKDGKKRVYITTAFADRGILQITFQKAKYKYKCVMTLKPAQMIYPNTKLRLAQESDYPAVCHATNEFIASVNAQCGEMLLPAIEDWRVKRIDYAVNIFTPHISEYIQLFYAGKIPKSFGFPKHYESSFYLTSKNGNINFYDKLHQARQKHGLSDADIENELHSLPSGMLRIEFQCSNKYIQHLKEHYRLEDTTLPFLWNADIAEHELKSRVKSIIGENDFFSYDICEQKIEQRYERATLGLYRQIFRKFRDSSYASLDDVEGALLLPSKKRFSNLLHKIRKVGVNPIPLDVCNNCSVTELPNPYRLIQCE